MYGNYVDKIYNNRPEAATRSEPKMWTSRWAGTVLVLPKAGGTTEFPSNPADVLLDWDGLELSGLVLDTSSQARVQLTDILVANLELTLGGTGYVDISSRHSLAATVYQPDGHICYSAASVRQANSSVQLQNDTTASMMGTQDQSFNITSLVGQVSLNVWANEAALPAGTYSYDVHGMGRPLNFSGMDCNPSPQLLRHACRA